MPRVSIILPNYNYARYLKERVRSILNQTFSDFELIYLDDASKDESNLIIEEFGRDPRVQIHKFTENSGKVYQRWNDGAEKATGEWLWFAGADDTAHPHFLERLLKMADQHPTAVILHCRMGTMDSEGRIVAVKWHADPDFMQHMESDYFSTGLEEAVRLTGGCFLSSASSMLLRRDVFESAGRFDTRLWSAADWDLYSTMLKEGDIAFRAEPLVFYRAHPNTVTKNTRSIIRAVEDAYCAARAYLWIKEQPGCTPEMRTIALRRVKMRVFDIFIDSKVVIPENLHFAAKVIYEAAPDRRLRMPPCPPMRV